MCHWLQINCEPARYIYKNTSSKVQSKLEESISVNRHRDIAIGWLNG
jgi:hypothetical protein